MSNIFPTAQSRKVVLRDYYSGLPVVSLLLDFCAEW